MKTRPPGRAGLSRAAIALVTMLAGAGAAWADTGDTAWILTSTALVLFMTLPGLALFYGGLVQWKNLLSVLAQCLAIACLMSLLWFVAGYSIAFGDANGLADGTGPFWGGLGKAFLAGIAPDATVGTIPETVFVMFQMTFAIITPALIVGAYAERVNFAAVLAFSGLWLLLVYAPVAHWVWGGGWLSTMGLLDFAGGTVVHINAGIAGIVAALVLGARRGYPHENLSPHDLSLAVIGTALLWVGWFGFNGGSALGSGSRATMAILVTHLAACSGALAWMFAEWATRGKPSVLGVISGVIAGLGTITPASGFVLPWHAVVIGLLAGLICFWACTKLKQRLGYDDSLDVFGIHGVGGTLGTLLTGVFAVGALSATAETPGGSPGLIEGNAAQVYTQLIGVGATIVWSGVVTWILLKVIGAFVGLRVSDEAERMGLDITQHGEAVQ